MDQQRSPELQTETVRQRFARTVEELSNHRMDKPVNELKYQRWRIHQPPYFLPADIAVFAIHQEQEKVVHSMTFKLGDEEVLAVTLGDDFVFSKALSLAPQTDTDAETAAAVLIGALDHLRTQNLLVPASNYPG